MSFETQKNVLNKTQKIIMADVQSEQWISRVRLAFAGFFTIISCFGFLMESTTLNSFLIQAIAVVILFSYSSVYLFSPRRFLFGGGVFVFILAFLDVLVITLILWSYGIGSGGFLIVNYTLYGVYFIAISFTTLHHRTSLSIFIGVLSVIGYSVLYYVFTRNSTFSTELLTDFCVRASLILVFAGLGSIVSRNNLKTIQQVITSEKRYHNLVHKLPEMMFTLDSSGNFLWSNIASHSILGVPANVIIGRNIRSFLINPELLKFEKSGIKGSFEIHDFNNNRKFVDCVIQSITEEENGNVAFEGLMSDVTDRELAISQREEMVNRLFQFQKMESLGTLTSGMAHDFNNILQTVNEITSQVDHESQETQTKKKMKLIIEAMADARFLISELFALGRKQPLDYRNIDLVNFFNTIIPQISNQLGPNYKVIFEVENESLWIQGDPDYLKRVFQNLVGNARDAMPEGGSIFVSCCSTKVEGTGMVTIKVSDTGTGIPPELKEKIFDPFFTTKKPGKGTGLGLALVRRIIMLHNGTIFVEKTGYEGTIFKIDIPKIDETELENDTKAILLNRKYSGIIVLDDDPKIREVLKIFLKEFKYPVYEASNSDEALLKMRANQSSIETIIMDWKIGNENPHDVIKAIRLLKDDIIVIVVSGYPPHHKSIEEMHIHKWFTKPYDKNQLDIEIQKALHRAHMARTIQSIV